jgi:hypothetical protein
MKPKLLLVILIFTMVGCTDTIDSVCREYRNTNNEIIDALMMVTDEDSADRMKKRVIDPAVFRYRDIDARLTIVRSNRTKKEFVKETLESDGFQLYLTDLEVNRQRLSLEICRLRNLAEGYEKEERKKLNDPEQPVNLASVCPTLHKFVYMEGTLQPVMEQLKQPKLLDMVAQFGDWKVEGLGEMLKAFNAKREKSFQVKQKIDLVK